VAKVLSIAYRMLGRVLVPSPKTPFLPVTLPYSPPPTGTLVLATGNWLKRSGRRTGSKR